MIHRTNASCNHRVLPTLPREGDGIRLREFCLEDAPLLADIEYDPEVKRFLDPPSIERSDWIRRFSERVRKDSFACCAIDVLPECVLAGRVSIPIYCLDLAGEKREFQVVIAKAFWGRKLGRKAADILIPAAFQELHAPAVIGIVHPENKRSLALLGSWGFEYREQIMEAAYGWQQGHRIYELTREAYNRRMQAAATSPQDAPGASPG